ncbi:E3 ubiquitin-protein ligase-like [Polyodon spathula]|uniref:E3 ubiquitin-protein ligase-like n=1 Tax=Polyodon spathula TaxID=7913 RepID=UPI001B7E82CF|nr:E3 ubiquitin-protein ligase-like [Polyodon spathula]
MCTELECGICYRAFNRTRRCPRKLDCSHSFCERCLVTLAGPPGSDTEDNDENLRGSPESGPDAEARVVCPLCRRSTWIPSPGAVRRQLPLDEAVLERMEAGGVQDEEGDSEGEEAADSAADGSSSAGSNKPKFWGVVKRFWKKHSNGNRRHNNRQRICCTSEDLKDIALMTCYSMI